jgi:hypothetical protein
LSSAARLAGWARPTATDATRRAPETPEQKIARGANTGWSQIDLAHLATPARLTVSGEMQIGYGAETEPSGQLSPDHSRWLMGYPPEWCACAAMVTRSTLRKRRSSSAK